jgi:hypothetical protein
VSAPASAGRALTAGTLAALAVLSVSLAVPAQRRARVTPAELGIVVPPENDARLTQPIPLPAPGDLEARAARLFEAIVRDTPEGALELFFPRGPFLVLKGIDDPGHYHDVLVRHYVADIHSLHATLPDLERAQFAGLTLSRRATWQTVRSEANALPYWAVRHSLLRYTVGGAERSFEVKALIHWGQRWYITHLL